MPEKLPPPRTNNISRRNFLRGIGGFVANHWLLRGRFMSCIYPITETYDPCVTKSKNPATLLRDFSHE